LTYDLDIQEALKGCEGTCPRKISSSKVQQFMSHYGNRETRKHLIHWKQYWQCFQGNRYSTRI